MFKGKKIVIQSGYLKLVSNTLLSSITRNLSPKTLVIGCFEDIPEYLSHCASQLSLVLWKFQVFIYFILVFFIL